MKGSCIKKYIIGLLTCVLFLGNMSVMPVEAGSSDLIVDKSSFQEELDTTLWNATDSRVTAENGKIVFSAESKKNTVLITKMIAKKTGYHDELVSVDTTMNLKNIPAEKTFAVALGLGGIEAVMGEPGNVEVQFTNNGGLKMSVVVYDLDGNKTEVVSPRAVNNTSNVKVKATISADAVLSVSLNGSRVCNEKIPVSGEGRVGFLQTGTCAAVISDVKITAHRYERPENCDIYEDFEQESINANLLTSKSVFVGGKYTPFGIGIKDVDGNRGFEFKNVTAGYLGSMYQYSNFELTFDVIESLREAQVDEEGKILLPRNGAIVVSFGDEAEDYAGWGYETSADAVVLDENCRVYSMSFDHSQNAKAKGFDYASPDSKAYTIRVSVIDGVVTTSLKWIDAENFTEILKYKVSDINPLGFVHIWGVGAPTNFTIDNVTLVNKDIDPNLIEVDFKSALYEVPEDFKYEKIDYVYRESNADEQETQFSPYIMIPIVALVCAAAFGVTTLFMKKRTKKEVGVNVQE